MEKFIKFHIKGKKIGRGQWTADGWENNGLVVACSWAAWTVSFISGTEALWPPDLKAQWIVKDSTSCRLATSWTDLNFLFFRALVSEGGSLAVLYVRGKLMPWIKRVWWQSTKMLLIETEHFHSSIFKLPQNWASGWIKPLYFINFLHFPTVQDHFSCHCWKTVDELNDHWITGGFSLWET